MEISIQKEIDLVNEIIRTAINHGGDQGGAYYTNWDCLQTAIGEWLYARGLADAYTPSNDVAGIVSIKKVSFSNQASDGSIWSLVIPAVDINGKKKALLRNGKKSVKTDYIPIDPVLNSNCAAEDRVASNITLNIIADRALL